MRWLRRTRPRKADPTALSTDELIVNMDKLLPKWKQYEAGRKAKVPREKRRGLKEYGEFDRYYSALRKRGLKLRDV